jgi:hypothetical protein
MAEALRDIFFVHDEPLMERVVGTGSCMNFARKVLKVVAFHECGRRQLPHAIQRHKKLY